MYALSMGTKDSGRIRIEENPDCPPIRQPDLLAIPSADLRTRLKRQQDWFQLMHGKRTVDLKAKQRRLEQKQKTEQDSHVMRFFIICFAHVLAGILYVVMVPIGIFAMLFEKNPHRVYLDSVLGFLTPRLLQGIDMLGMGFIDVVTWPFRSKRDRQGDQVDNQRMWLLRIPILLAAIVISMTLLMVFGSKLLNV